MLRLYWDYIGLWDLRLRLRCRVQGSEGCLELVQLGGGDVEDLWVVEFRI